MNTISCRKQCEEHVYMTAVICIVYVVCALAKTFLGAGLKILITQIFADERGTKRHLAAHSTCQMKWTRESRKREHGGRVKWEPEIGQRPPSTPNPFGYSVQLLVAICRPDGRHCHSIILAPALAYFLTPPETTTTPTTSHRQTNKNGSHTHTQLQN